MDGDVEATGHWYVERPRRHALRVEYPVPADRQMVQELLDGFVAEFGDDLGLESAHIVASEDSLQVEAVVEGMFIDTETVVTNLTDLLTSLGIEPKFGIPPYRISPLDSDTSSTENDAADATLEA